MWVQVPLLLRMKIEREKRIREEYTEGAIERIASRMVGTLTGETKGKKRK